MMRTTLLIGRAAGPYRSLMLATVAATALGAASSALAQTAPAAAPSSAGAPSGVQVEEVVVTAQKKSERLLDVPVPVSAVSADTLTKQSIVKIEDFYNRIPSLQLAGARTSNLSIRGITTGGNTSPTVAILIDDVAFGGSTNAGQPPFPDFDPGTIEQIEVLRGPQGTLYGASSLGGLLKYVTRSPNLHSFTGDLQVGAETVDGGTVGYSARGSVSIPVINDKVAVSLSAFDRDDPRWIDDIYPSNTKKDVNEKRTWGGRGAVLLKPTDDLKITLSGMYERFNSQFSDLSLSNGIPVCPPCQPRGNTAVTNFVPIYGQNTIRLAGGNTGEATYQLYTGRIDYDLHWAQLTSVTAYNKSDNALVNDVTPVFGGFLLPAVGAPAGSTVSISNADYTHRFSEELRLSHQGERLDWLLGGFYDHEDASTNQSLFVNDPGGALLSTPYIGAGPSTYREIAGFADVTWHATDKLDIQVGGRYAGNKQTSTAKFDIAPPAQPFFGPSSTVSAPSSGDAFTWLISPSYHINHDLMAYARVATGYRPGGPNVGAPPNVQKSYDSDSVTSFDIGLKGYVIPGALSLDISLFDIEWKDIQLQDTDAISQLTFLTNGGTARSRGLEFSAQWRPWTGMTVDGNAAFTDAKLTEDLPTPPGGTALSGAEGDRLPFTAKFTTSISAEQDFPISSRVLGFVGATYTYVGDRLSAFRTNSPAATEPRFTLPAYSLVDLRAGVNVDDVWDLSLYARNIFNKSGVVTATNRNGTAPPTAIFTQPRTIGVTLSRSF